ncbi:MAG TPA: type II toxin-antitoxin system HicA family toxin [Thermodesulfobacteriota bacterium]|jgi:predicted RNA binding protein YcfA (HicA-like mRNA interferase family)
MVKLKPEKPNEMIRKLRALGYEGPFPGGRHLFMRHPITKYKIPVPYHKGRDIPKGTVREIIKELGITVENWNKL